jgi:hypothetical protein
MPIVAEAASAPEPAHSAACVSGLLLAGEGEAGHQPAAQALLRLFQDGQLHMLSLPAMLVAGAGARTRSSLMHSDRTVTAAGLQCKLWLTTHMLASEVVSKGAPLALYILCRRWRGAAWVHDNPSGSAEPRSTRHADSAVRATPGVVGSAAAGRC